ncbi:hypothetical protein BgiBS90_033761 [Biomphalaria glabrata]|nr:hypothetical protein BgiBS90_033761 [Biomphalaria glabrata]
MSWALDDAVLDHHKTGSKFSRCDSLKRRTSQNPVCCRRLNCSGRDALDPLSRLGKLPSSKRGSRRHSLCHIIVKNVSESSFKYEQNIRRSSSLTSYRRTGTSSKRSSLKRESGQSLEEEKTADVTRSHHIHVKTPSTEKLAARTETATKVINNRLRVIRGREWYLINHRSIKIGQKDLLLSDNESLGELKRRLDIYEAVAEYTNMLLALGFPDNFMIDAIIYKDALSKKTNYLTYREIYQSEIMNGSHKLSLPMHQSEVMNGSHKLSLPMHQSEVMNGSHKLSLSMQQTEVMNGSHKLSLPMHQSVVMNGSHKLSLSMQLTEVMNGSHKLSLPMQQSEFMNGSHRLSLSMQQTEVMNGSHKLSLPMHQSEVMNGSHKLSLSMQQTEVMNGSHKLSLPMKQAEIMNGSSLPIQNITALSEPCNENEPLSLLGELAKCGDDQKSHEEIQPAKETKTRDAICNQTNTCAEKETKGKPESQNTGLQEKLRIPMETKPRRPVYSKVYSNSAKKRSWQNYPPKLFEKLTRNTGVEKQSVKFENNLVRCHTYRSGAKPIWSGENERNSSVESRHQYDSSKKRTRSEFESLFLRYKKGQERDRDERPRSALASNPDYAKHDKKSPLRHKHRPGANGEVRSRTSRKDTCGNSFREHDKRRRRYSSSGSRSSRSSVSLNRRGSTRKSRSLSKRCSESSLCDRPSKRFKEGVSSERSADSSTSSKRSSHSENLKRSPRTCCCRDDPKKQKSAALVPNTCTSDKSIQQSNSDEASKPRPLISKVDEPLQESLSVSPSIIPSALDVRSLTTAIENHSTDCNSKKNTVLNIFNADKMTIATQEKETSMKQDQNEGQGHEDNVKGAFRKPKLIDLIQLQLPPAKCAKSSCKDASRCCASIYARIPAYTLAKCVSGDPRRQNLQSPYKCDCHKLEECKTASQEINQDSCPIYRNPFTFTTTVDNDQERKIDLDVKTSSVTLTECSQCPPVKIYSVKEPSQKQSVLKSSKGEPKRRKLPKFSFPSICSLLTKAQTIYALSELCNVPRPVSPLPPDERTVSNISQSPKSFAEKGGEIVSSPRTQKVISENLDVGAFNPRLLSGFDDLCEITVVKLFGAPASHIVYITSTNHVTDSEDLCSHSVNSVENARGGYCPLTLQKLCFIIIAKNKNIFAPKPVRACCVGSKSSQNKNFRVALSGKKSSSSVVSCRQSCKRNFAEVCSDRESCGVLKCSKETKVSIANVNNSNDSDDEPDSDYCHLLTGPTDTWDRYVCDDMSTPIVLSAADRVYHVSGSKCETAWAPVKGSDLLGFTPSDLNWSSELIHVDAHAAATTQASVAQLVNEDLVQHGQVQQDVGDILLNSNLNEVTEDILAQAMESAGLSERNIRSFLHSDFSIQSFLLEEAGPTGNQVEADDFLNSIFCSFNNDCTENMPSLKDKQQEAEVIDFTTTLGLCEPENDTQLFHENNQHTCPWSLDLDNIHYDNYAPYDTFSSDRTWCENLECDGAIKSRSISSLTEQYIDLDFDESDFIYLDTGPLSDANDPGVCPSTNQVSTTLNSEQLSDAIECLPGGSSDACQYPLTSLGTGLTKNVMRTPSAHESISDLRGGKKRRKSRVSASKIPATCSVSKQLKLRKNFAKAVATYTGNNVNLAEESCLDEDKTGFNQDKSHCFVARTLDYVRRWSDTKAPTVSDYIHTVPYDCENSSKFTLYNDGSVNSRISNKTHINSSENDQDSSASGLNTNSDQLPTDNTSLQCPVVHEFMSSTQQTIPSSETYSEARKKWCGSLNETISPTTLTTYFNEQQQTLSLFTQQMLKLSPGFLKRSKKNSQSTLESRENRVSTKIFRVMRHSNHRKSYVSRTTVKKPNQSRVSRPLDVNNNASWDRAETGGSKLKSAKNSKIQDSKKSAANEGRLQLPRVCDTSSSLEKDRKKLEKATDKFRKHHQTLHQAPRTLSLLQRPVSPATDMDSTAHPTPSDLSQFPLINNARSGNENQNKSPIDTVCTLPAMASASARESSKVLKFVKRLDSQYGDQLAHGDVDTKQRLNKFCKSYLTQHSNCKKKSQSSSSETKMRDKSAGFVPSQSSDKIDNDINILAAHNAIEPSSNLKPIVGNEINSPEAVPVADGIEQSTNGENSRAGHASKQSQNASSVKKSTEAKAKPIPKKTLLRSDIASSVNRLAAKPPSPTKRLMYKIQSFEREFKKPFSISDNIEQNTLANGTSKPSSPITTLAARDKCIKDAKKLLPVITGGRADSAPRLEVNKPKCLLAAKAKEPQIERGGFKIVKNVSKEESASSKAFDEPSDEFIKDDQLETRQSIMNSLTFGGGDIRTSKKEDSKETTNRMSSLNVHKNNPNIVLQDSPNIEIKSLEQLKRMTDHSFAMEFPDYFKHSQKSSHLSRPTERRNDTIISRRLEGTTSRGTSDVTFNIQRSIEQPVQTSVFHINAKEKESEDKRNKLITVISPTSNVPRKYFSVALPDGVPEELMREPVTIPEDKPKSEAAESLEKEFQQFLDECRDDEKELLTADDDYLSEFDDIDVEDAKMYLLENTPDNQEQRSLSDDLNTSSPSLSPSKIQNDVSKGELGIQLDTVKRNSPMEQGGGDGSTVKSTSILQNLTDDNDSDCDIFKVESLTSIKNSMDKALSDSFDDITEAGVDLFQSSTDGSFWADSPNPWSVPAPYAPGQRVFKKLTPIQEVQEDGEEDACLTRDEP